MTASGRVDARSRPAASATSAPASTSSGSRSRGAGDTVTAEWLTEPGIRGARPRPSRTCRAIRSGTPSALAAAAVLAARGPACCRSRGIALSVTQGAAALGRPGRQRRLGGGGRGGGQRAARRRRSTRRRCSRPASTAEEAVAGRHARQPRPLAARRHRPRPLDATRSTWCALPVPAELYGGAGAAGSAAAHRRRPRRAAARDAARRSRCTRRPRWARWWPRSRSATTRCSAARSTTGSPSRRARGCSPGSSRPRRRRSAAGALGSSISGSGPTAFALARGAGGGGAGGRRDARRPTRAGDSERRAGRRGGPRRGHGWSEARRQR